MAVEERESAYGRMLNGREMKRGQLHYVNATSSAAQIHELGVPHCG